MTNAPALFDLQPDPRILPMLGEINLVQWRCLLMGRRSGTGDAAGVPPSTWAGYAPEVEP